MGSKELNLISAEQLNPKNLKRYRNKVIQALGTIDFAMFNVELGNYNIGIRKNPYCTENQYPNEHKDYLQKNAQIKIYELFTGKDFLNDVVSKNIIDDDGTISEIIVDGHISNLGLITDTFQQGNFLVDKNIFQELCEHHQIFVNYAHK